MASQDIPSFVLPDNYTSPSWPSLGEGTHLYLLSGAAAAAYPDALRATAASSKWTRALTHTSAGRHAWGSRGAVDVWLFVMIWTIVLSTTVYLGAAVWILFVFGKNRLAWIAALAFLLFGALVSAIVGAIIGTFRVCGCIRRTAHWCSQSGVCAVRRTCGP